MKHYLLIIYAIAAILLSACTAPPPVFCNCRCDGGYEGSGIDGLIVPQTKEDNEIRVVPFGKNTDGEKR